MPTGYAALPFIAAARRGSVNRRDRQRVKTTSPPTMVKSTMA
jgi:hypothetical protein